MEERGAGENKPFMRHVIAIMVIVGSFGAFYMVAAGKCDTAWEKTTFMVVGALVSLVTTIVQWYFGSSEGSDRKTNLLSRGEKL